jgi:CheY-like chemotaxis protein/HPt (histidine-containing phosphotransfer) domain-containing protein
VEDNHDIQKLAIRLLEKHGFLCDVASDGLEAVTRFAQGLYPLVLMDCQMPVMDGFDATRLIRRQDSANPFHTPIIALTAHAFAEDRARCLAAGMDDYISKPVDENSLISTIRRWLPADQTPASVESIAGLGLQHLIPDYLSHQKQDLKAIGEAVTRGDLTAARNLGHGMKGSGSSYGFPAITEFGRSIEQCAIAQDQAGIEQQICRMKEYLLQLEVDYRDSR